MLVSNGALAGNTINRKSVTTIWQGTPAEWPAWLPTGGAWASYAELYRKQLWVSTVIDKRAKAAARLPFKIYERSDDDGRVDASSSPFGQLMARPSRTVDAFLFWLWTVSTKDIHGEAFWLKVRDRGGRPIELLLVHPTKVVDELDRDTGKVTWKIRLRDGDVIVERRDLVHFREFNPDSLTRGMSKLEPLRATLENEDGARRANSALWRNGGRPSVWLEHPARFSNDNVVTRLRTQWNEIHAGVDNWAKAAILEEGMKANVMPVNNDELQYIEVRKLNREEVCAAYDMAPPVVHILDRATFSNITEQHRSMYRDTMGPILGSLEATIEFELRDGRYGEYSSTGQPDFGAAFYGEFLLDEILRGAFEARQDALAKADYLTLAEKRRIENLPFIPGTEHIYINSASLPIGPDGQLISPTPAGAPQLALPPGKAMPVDPHDASRSAGADTRLPGLAATPAVALSTATMRAVMGRLSRAKSLLDVDPEAIVAGLGPDADIVLQHLIDAQLAGDTVDGLKDRIRREHQ